ncbi:MAG: MurR/RpiR family transcriptional regulator [Hespellia sp.]|nr:MurR/RpiR family transcriptional regulator [Hespellia sp.]
MNVLQNLTTFYNQLPPESTYRNVCQGILEHMGEAAEGTIYDLAELTNSSRTTVWRMVQKMGYKSFSDFHHELKRAVRQYDYYNRILPQEECVSTEIIKESLLRQVMKAYESMRDQTDTKALEQIAFEMSQADKVHFYTPIHSSSICSLQQNLAMSGKETDYFCLMPEMLEGTKALTDKSIVFVNTIDHVETMDLSEVFDNIKEHGAKILGITNHKSKYKEYIDCEILSESADGVAQGMIMFDTYFYMLSEIYRMKYIG